MRPVTILLAAAALAASVATAQAQVPHQRADGLWVCPNDETRVIINGDWRVVCYSDVPAISRREFRRGPRAIPAGRGRGTGAVAEVQPGVGTVQRNPAPVVL